MCRTQPRERIAPPRQSGGNAGPRPWAEYGTHEVTAMAIETSLDRGDKPVREALRLSKTYELPLFTVTVTPGLVTVTLLLAFAVAVATLWRA